MNFSIIIDWFVVATIIAGTIQLVHLFSGRPFVAKKTFVHWFNWVTLPLLIALLVFNLFLISLIIATPRVKAQQMKHLILLFANILIGK
jgi:hypothetical protein